MPFESAELKSLAEEAWAEGIPLSASQAGHYFFLGHLATLVDQAVDLAVERRQATDAYYTAIKDVNRLTDLVDGLESELDRVEAFYLLAYEDYMHARDNIEEYHAHQASIRSTRNQITENEERIMELEGDFHSAIWRVHFDEEAAQELRDEIEELQERIDYWQDQADEASMDWYYCRIMIGWYAPVCQDVYDEWQYLEGDVDRLEEDLEDKEAELQALLGWIEEGQDEMEAIRTETDRLYDLNRRLRHTLQILLVRAGNLDQFIEDRDDARDELSDLDRRKRIIRMDLEDARPQLQRALAAHEEYREKTDDLNEEYERMIDRWW